MNFQCCVKNYVRSDVRQMQGHSVLALQIFNLSTVILYQSVNIFWFIDRALLRAMFKGTVSAFIPLIIFFFNLSHGRTRYDRLFGSIVVDISSLNRPVFVDGQRFHHLDVNVNQRQGVGQLFLQVR